MSTPHINAKKEDIAKIVIVAGDPLRIKFFAEKYLKNSKLVNTVRGMYAYTGEIDGIRVTLMGHGMGMSSIGIYSYELFKFYDVEIIIRAGSCGSYVEDINVYDIIVCDSAYTESNFGEGFNYFEKEIKPDSKLLKAADQVAKNQKELKIFMSKVSSSMWFYNQNPKFDYKNYVKLGVKASEMESYALYLIAKVLNRKALTVLTVTDNIPKEDVLPAEQRETSLSVMFEYIIQIIKKFLENEK